MLGFLTSAVNPCSALKELTVQRKNQTSFQHTLYVGVTGVRDVFFVILYQEHKPFQACREGFTEEGSCLSTV